MDIWIYFAAGAFCGYVVSNMLWRWFTGAALKQVAKAVLDFDKRLDRQEKTIEYMKGDITYLCDNNVVPRDAA